MRRSFGCGSLIFVFLISITIIVVGGYFAFNAYISPYLNDAQLREIYNIYTDLSEDVNESELVTNSPAESDYTNAQTKLEQNGIEIFDQYGDIDPALIDETNFLPESSIILSDKELASVINKFIANPLNLEQLGIDPESIGGLNTQVLEVNITEVSPTVFNLSFIVKLDMQSIKTQFGVFGLFIPDALYLNSESILELENNEYTLVSGEVHVNDLEQEKNDRILEILSDALSQTNEDVTVETLNRATGELILRGITEASTTFNTTISFDDGVIIFTPIAT